MIYSLKSLWHDVDLYTNGPNENDAFNTFGGFQVICYELFPNGDYQVLLTDGSSQFYLNEYVDNSTAEQFNWANGDGTYSSRWSP